MQKENSPQNYKTGLISCAWGWLLKPDSACSGKNLGEKQCLCSDAYAERSR